ncbi:hypothetical protein [Arenibacter certesii]|nr:hypothetical protein [Arenibacter certesii]
MCTLSQFLQGWKTLQDQVLQNTEVKKKDAAAIANAAISIL